MSLLIKGLMIGLTIAMPFGPLGLLCMNYALSRGFRMALIVGLGASIADALLTAGAGLGLTSLGVWMTAQRHWIHLAGSLLLLYLGAKLYLYKPADRPPLHRQAGSGCSAFFSSFFLTLSNPLTLIVLAALISNFLDEDPSNDLFHAALLMLGVFFGSMIWWLAISWGASKLKKRFTEGWVRSARRFAGAAILAFGMLALAASFYPATTP